MSGIDSSAVDRGADETSAPPATATDALAMMRVYREDQLKLERRLVKVEQVIEQLRVWLGQPPRRPAPGWRRKRRRTGGGK